MGVFSSLDLVRSHNWSQSFFTTYALSLSFFEAVVLDALVRQNVGDNMILADVEGVRASLAEYGARSAGRAYEVEPVSVKGGCFHPKLMVLTSSTETHMVVGSGNLTFGGWGSNLECADHLHPAFAAAAFLDAADFLEALATAPRITHAASEACGALADRLRGRTSGHSVAGDIRLFHSLNQSIQDQVVEVADDLGGAVRLMVAAPYFDRGKAIDRLCSRLGLDHVFIHSHDGGTVSGTFGSNWPTEASVMIHPVRINLLHEEEPRKLHAKVFEIDCRSGRIVLSGSANATSAALLHDGNVELCVARIERDSTVSWHHEAASPPAAFLGPIEMEDADSPAEGVLRASISGGKLEGQVITSFPAGVARIFLITGIGPKEIGQVTVEVKGCFSFASEDIEEQAWQSQRLIIRLESDNGTAARGLVSFSEYGNITRMAGPMAHRFFSVLSGNETPDDVAAIMSWFQDNNSLLTPENAPGGTKGNKTQGSGGAKARVSSLLNPLANHLPSEDGDPTTSNSAARFMRQIFAAFKRPRGRIPPPDDPDDPSKNNKTGSSTRTSNNQNQLAQYRFEKLIDLMLDAPPERRDLSMVVGITQFVCDRIDIPDFKIRGYLGKIHHTFTSGPLVEDERSLMAALALTFHGVRRAGDVDGANVRGARRSLLRLRYDLLGPLPDLEPVQTFANLLVDSFDWSRLWENVQSIRTVQEEIVAYRNADNSPLLESDYPILSNTPEWSELVAAAANPKSKQAQVMSRFSNACPKCHMVLPKTDESRLKQYGIARASNCCKSILLCEEP